MRGSEGWSWDYVFLLPFMLSGNCGETYTDPDSMPHLLYSHCGAPVSIDSDWPWTCESLVFLIAPSPVSIEWTPVATCRIHAVFERVSSSLEGYRHIPSMDGPIRVAVAYSECRA
jgi:hypothetical protein